jgi:hypothetical protein
MQLRGEPFDGRLLSLGLTKEEPPQFLWVRLRNAVHGKNICVLPGLKGKFELIVIT